MTTELTSAQAAAIKYIERYSAQLRTVGQAELVNVLAMSNLSSEALEAAQSEIQKHAQVGLQFHLDRICKDGRTVAQALAEDGQYRNQFQTHVSNGGLDPVAAGKRATWEDALFGGVFSAPNAALAERPKYGALDLMLFPDGPCPRYGSAYFLLKPGVSQRCTFTYMDSHREPPERGTLKAFEPLIAALMTECFERSFALGRSPISPPQLVSHLTTNLCRSMSDRFQEPAGRNLNHYIEAQVHGDINLSSDVDAIVVDPCFKYSPTEEFVHRTCDRHQIELYWHGGFKLEISEVPDDFRGPTMPSLARRITTDTFLDARMIGDAAADLKKNPLNWSDRGTYDTVLQELKCLWHVLVHVGQYPV